MILTQEQEMIREAMRIFAQERLAPFAGEWDRNHTFPAEALKELADALNVFDVVCKHLGFSPEEVRQAQQKKLEKDGGLGSGVWIEYVVLADDSEWIETFRAQPDKYREEKI